MRASTRSVSSRAPATSSLTVTTALAGAAPAVVTEAEGDEENMPPRAHHPRPTAKPVLSTRATRAKAAAIAGGGDVDAARRLPVAAFLSTLPRRDSQARARAVGLVPDMSSADLIAQLSDFSRCVELS